MGIFREKAFRDGKETGGWKTDRRGVDNVCEWDIGRLVFRLNNTMKSITMSVHFRKSVFVLI